ncbi:MAG: hypothetical protein GX813_02480 [Erysipelotrichia bacterium]|nr:hypothetical protein [Erysipelotrichia bacterium]
MKKLRQGFLLLIFCTFTFTMSSCSWGGGNKDDSPGVVLSADMFEGYRANLDGATALGIVKKELAVELAPTERAVQRRIAFANENKTKNKLIVFSDDVQAEVVFEKETPEDGKIILNQDNINAQFDKLHITEDYIFFTLTVNSITPREEGDMEYDEIDYVCDTFNQSFLIDRQTFNIYSLAELPHIDKIDGNIFRTSEDSGHGPIRYTFYEVTIEENQIKFRDLVPNKNINPFAVYVNKQGTLFVKTDTTNQITDTVVYVTDTSDIYDGFFHTMGDDGQFYRVQTVSDISAIWVFNDAIGDWDIPNQDDVFAIPGMCLFKNDVIYASLGGNYRIYKPKIVNGVLTTDYAKEGISDPHAEGIVHWAAKCLIVQENIYCYDLIGKVTVYVTDTYENSLIAQEITISGITSIEAIADEIFVTKEEFDGTKKYRLYVEDNEPKYELMIDITYDENVIVIKPL